MSEKFPRGGGGKPILSHPSIGTYTEMFRIYRHAATTFYQLQGVSGAGGNMHGSRDFCQSYLVLSLFYSLQRGSNGFIVEKTIRILY